MGRVVDWDAIQRVVTASCVCTETGTCECITDTHECKSEVGSTRCDKCFGPLEDKTKSE